jgi:uncharacterized protein (DUF952 family)
MTPAHAFVFKVARREEWAQACRRGSYGGSRDDLRDGYIHLSAFPQLAGTLAKHFRGQEDLVLIKLDTRALGAALLWEPSRGGDLFPHLHADLPVAAAREVYTLALDEEGVPAVPKEVAPC